MKITVNEFQSSNVEAFGYRPETKTLRVRFKGGKEYDYLEVATVVFGNMIGSVVEGFSVGKYINKFIKPNHSCQQVGDCETMNPDTGVSKSGSAPVQTEHQVVPEPPFTMDDEPQD